jgi:hypothetical protein
LDWLRDTLAPVYEEKARPFLKDPWAARNDYINVVLDRSGDSVNQFLALHATRELTEEERVTTLKLLELQRHAMLMYTSCGWFFDELSGIETVQVMQYAGRAIQLAAEACGVEVEPVFVQKLAEAKSNAPEHGNGALIYEKFVKPAMVDLEKVGAHYAISSLFESYEERVRIYCYTAEREDSQVFEAGKARLAVGRARLTSAITGESALLGYGAATLGDQNVKAGVRGFPDERSYQEVKEQLVAPFDRADFAEILRWLDEHFGEATYSLQSLFGDEQRKIVNLILESKLGEATAAYRQVYDQYAPLMRYLAGLGVPLPGVFLLTAEFVLNDNLRRAFEEGELDLQRIRTLLDTAEREGARLDSAGLGYALGQAVENLMKKFQGAPDDIRLLQTLEAFGGLVQTVPFEVQLRKVQNLYYEMLQSVYPEFRSRTDEQAQVWVKHFVALGEKLHVYVEPS